jgi:hypothetical protein
MTKVFWGTRVKIISGIFILSVGITFLSQAQFVGIGTNSPTTNLHVQGGASVGLLVQNINGTGQAGLELKSSTTANTGLSLIHYNSNAGGSIAGVSLAGTSTILSNINNSGGLLIGSSNNAPFLIATNNLRRITITQTGSMAIGNANPNTSAQLDIQGTAGGLLIPRLTTAQRNAVATPANGLMIYNTTTNSLNYFKTGDGWTELGGDGGPNNAWLTTGNFDAPTNPILGTYNQSPLRLVVAGQHSGLLWYDAEANTFAGYASGVPNQTGNNNNKANTGFGTSTLTGLSTGDRNTAVGTEAGFSTSTGSRNVYMGRQAGYLQNTQSGNVAIGASALYNRKGNDNIAIGDSAYFGGATGSPSGGNIAIGKRTLGAATTAGSNIAIGRLSLGFITTGTNNTVIGHNAFAATGATDGGQQNIAIGSNAMFSAQGGLFNIAMGGLSLNNNEGDYNISFGSQSMFSNTTGNRNIAVGNRALYSSTNTTHQIAIGDSALQSYIGTGEGNVALGARAGWQLTSGSQNTIVGRNALADGFFTNNNVAIGFEAGKTIQGGGSNVMIGHSSTAKNSIANGSTAIGAEASAGYINSTAIGYQASTTGNNRMAFGNESVANWIFGRTSVTAGRALEVGTNNTNGNGAYLTAGGTWTNNSDINLKEDITKISTQDILQKIAAMPITRWKYTGTNEYHIGPMAQDFHAAFNTGTDNKSISSIDPAGVALAAIQALIEKNEKLEQEIQALKNQMKLLK